MPLKDAVVDRMETWCDTRLVLSWLQISNGRQEGHSLFEWAVSLKNNGQLKHPALPGVEQGTQVCCFEAILLALAMSAPDIYDRSYFKDFYAAAFGQKNIDGSWVPLLLLGRSMKGPIQKTPYSPDSTLARGQLVFFKDGAHVCIATGNQVVVEATRKDTPELLSFWGPYPKLRRPERPTAQNMQDVRMNQQPATPTVVMRSSIASMLQYFRLSAEWGMTQAGEIPVTFGDPFWAQSS